MTEPIVVTLCAVAFLAVLFRTGDTFRRRNVDVDGEPPIDRTAFYLSKYSILLVWSAMVLHSWGVVIPAEITSALKWPSLILWFSGFGLLFLGRLGLGSSFRIGSPHEETRLRTDGLFTLSRNPMYLGVYATLVGAVIYTMNPFILAVAVFIVVTHHRIVLAEERFLRGAFGESYARYSSRVPRYL